MPSFLTWTVLQAEVKEASYSYVKVFRFLIFYIRYLSTHINVTGRRISASTRALCDMGELRSLTERDSSFPHFTPGVVPSIPTCI